MIRSQFPITTEGTDARKLLVFDAEAWNDVEQEFAKLLESFVALRIIFDAQVANTCVYGPSSVTCSETLPTQSSRRSEQAHLTSPTPAIGPEAASRQPPNPFDEQTLCLRTREFLDKTAFMRERPGPYRDKLSLQDAYELVEAELNHALSEASETNGIPLGVLTDYVRFRFLFGQQS